MSTFFSLCSHHPGCQTQALIFGTVSCAANRFWRTAGKTMPGTFSQSRDVCSASASDLTLLKDLSTVGTFSVGGNKNVDFQPGSQVTADYIPLIHLCNCHPLFPHKNYKLLFWSPSGITLSFKPLFSLWCCSAIALTEHTDYGRYKSLCPFRYKSIARLVIPCLKAPFYLFCNWHSKAANPYNTVLDKRKCDCR